MTSGVFSVTELVQVSRSKSMLAVKTNCIIKWSYVIILFASAAPVVTGVGPSFSMGDLQGHLAYDLNQSVNQPVGIRRSLASTSSSG